MFLEIPKKFTTFDYSLLEEVCNTINNSNKGITAKYSIGDKSYSHVIYIKKDKLAPKSLREVLY